ncbi:MAG: ATP-dependent zinc metalloprotease FtsH [Clostridium sp.]|uniref:ATP-dependent zinc metalloprotease FtsH n=2 Tax=Lachnospiraceae TaxID=186803 RepID=A0A7G9FRD2_9FIRM|nr:ATP-dependent zinc metalloprotease FtsH [Lachnospiraceae bacterium]MBP8719365.1 ATP-dependent zinc metalloprotease FtsH [Lachnospiraceae bacterium]MBS6307344.1 ATP-dependent zinc metalloprotease FtsH [Clostridium sp.]QNM01114.1 ATP-dependent zinc metalloprotease FtsH [Wujia chipingensis]
MFCGIIWYMNKNSKTDSGYTIVDFQAEVSEDLIGSVEIYQNKEIPTGTVYITYRQTNEEKEFYVSDVNKVQQIIMSKGNGNIRLELHDVSGQSNVWTWLPTVVLIVVLLVVVMIFMANMSGAGGGGGAGGGKMMNFGKSRAHMSNENDQKYTFKDVAGLEEEKEDMAEIVDFLRNPKKYNTLGARIPKGVLLEGPPGTGKTLLAKAVAGEAGVPFFSISGSDFVEMFVGVGASRVRDLFEDAKKNAPCIVFIDEIDAVARKRGSGLGGGHDEREQTLNQMLVEMDGFGTNEGIIVLAATNRVDILDPAILRPGRFDRKVMVGRPDVKGREEILRVHVRNKPLSDDVDLHEIARTTAGFAGADLENLMNEAAICAAKQNRQFIKKEDVDKCFVKIGIGGEKKSRLVPEKERKITAYHESGHAILFHLLSEVGPVHLVSIIPNGRGAGGYTMPLPENDNVFMTKKHMLQDIMVSFGGRIAEELIFGDITTGASADIKQATQTAQAMVVKYGMSEKVGLINYEVNSEEEVFLGRDLGHARNYSEKVAAMIDKEVRRIMDECYQEAKLIIESHIDVLHRCAAALLEKERINRAEFEALFEVSPTETYPDGLDTTGLNL